jgi:hypothetical protein
MISAFSPLKKYALTTDASMRERKENKWYKERKREREKDRSHKRNWKRESKKGMRD